MDYSILKNCDKWILGQIMLFTFKYNTEWGRADVFSEQQKHLDYFIYLFFGQWIPAIFSFMLHTFT